MWKQCILLCVVAILVSAPVFANVHYVKPVEAWLLEDPVCSAPFVSNCLDSQFMMSSLYTEFADSSTSTGATLRLSANANQFSAVKLTYDVNALTEGEYYLRFFWDSTAAGELRIYGYNSTETVGASVFHSFSAGFPRWITVDVSSLVDTSFDTTGRLSFRVVNGGNNNRQIGAANLVEPFIFTDFQVIDNGVMLTALINATVQHQWTVASAYDVNASNMACHVRNVDSGDVMNLSTGFAWYDFDLQTGFFRWIPSVDDGYAELENYQVVCNADIEVVGTGYTSNITFSQFTYITGERTMMNRLTELVETLLTLLGIIEVTRVGDLDVFNSVNIDLQSVNGYINQELPISLFVATDKSLVMGSECFLNTYYPDGSQFIINQSFSEQSQGLYSTNISLPSVPTSLRSVAHCRNGLLQNDTIYATSMWNVDSGIRMQSVS